MPSSITIGRLIDIARARHPAFVDVAADGLMLAAIDARQRSLILQYGGAIDGLANSTVSLALAITGALLGVDDTGTPYYLNTVGDGYPAQLDDDGFIFVDTSAPLVSNDPFGENGGTPGFPLPRDFLKLISVSVVYDDQRVAPVSVIAETSRFARAPSATVPTAFVSGNRLVPLRRLASGNTGDAWTAQITSVQLSYIAMPVLESTSDPVLLPAPLTEALVAFIATQLAAHAPTVPPAERNRFATEELRITDSIEEYSSDVVGTAMSSTIQYRRR